MLEVVVLLAQLGAQFSDTALSQMLSKPSLADRFREVSALSTVKIALKLILKDIRLSGTGFPSRLL